MSEIKSALPKVSVITIVYNGAAGIERTIKSVLGQGYKNLEYIIVDGGSIDGTIDIVKKYEDKIARWVSEKDRGISDAMNKGIALATGDIVGMIHADDWYGTERSRPWWALS
ncbi:MAG TPA: glycosyltransferase [Candidatus Wallbacteria bacterium]|nr:glycosyltransferase [Candidatus Wallbacteria bacterium]